MKPIKLEVLNGDSKYCDTCIELDDTGVGITIFDYETTGKTIRVIKFGAYIGYVVHRYYADGSGSSDGYDCTDLGRITHDMNEAIVEALKGYVWVKTSMFREHEAKEAAREEEL